MHVHPSKEPNDNRVEQGLDVHCGGATRLQAGAVADELLCAVRQNIQQDHLYRQPHEHMIRVPFAAGPCDAQYGPVSRLQVAV